MSGAASGKKRWGTALLGVALLGAALGLSIHWRRIRPVAGRRPAREMAVTVQVLTVRAETARLPVEAHGEVVPARQVDLSAEVSGRIVARHARLEPGGRLA